MITQARLKELLHYNPSTGVFTRTIRRGPYRAGSICGHAFKHRNTHYRVIGIDGGNYKAHRLAWLYVYGKFPDDQIDHKDGNGLNNSLSNLRDVSNSENQKNARLRLNNTSGVAGVSFYKPDNKWLVRINTDSGRKFLGYYIDIKDAISARKAAEVEYGYHSNHGRE
jgi:hypothetical protein